MNILILGGTRFLGQRLAEMFSSNGHSLVILSRNISFKKKNIEYFRNEKLEGISLLKKKKFDLVFDFISFKKKDTEIILNNISFNHYFLISSTWVPKIWNGTNINDLRFEKYENSNLNSLTNKYLNGKIEVEFETFKHFEKYRNCSILRLPIFLGDGDKSNRLEFYFERFLDKKPLICIENNDIILQIAWVDDIAKILYEFSISSFPKDAFIWNSLPTNKIILKDLILKIGEYFENRSEITFFKLNEIKKNFQSYLLSEPFHNEKFFSLKKNNLFNFLKLKSTNIDDWIFKSYKRISLDSNLRKKEINLIESRKN